MRTNVYYSPGPRLLIRSCCLKSLGVLNLIYESSRVSGLGWMCFMRDAQSEGA
jgi:hypothetical protein